MNKRVLECLVRAGVLDSLGERNALLASLDQMMALSQEVHRARDVGQRSLFDLSPQLMKQSSVARFKLAASVPAAESEAAPGG